MKKNNIRITSNLYKKILILSFVLLSILSLSTNVFSKASAKSNYQLMVEDVTSKYTLDVTSEFNSKIVTNVPDEITELWVIVKLKYTSLVNYYKDSINNLKHYKSVGDYAKSVSGQKYMADTDKKINDTIEQLKNNNISFKKITNIYNTTMTGFACKVDIANYLELAASNLVEDLIVCEEYELPNVTFHNKNNVTEDAINNTYTYNTGIYDTSTLEYDGSGMVIAILDTGCDINHSAMQTMPNVSTFTEENIDNVLTQLNAYKSTGEIATIDNFYMNRKIVYAFDYADNDFDVYPGKSDHGLHVAGIIAGNDDIVTGSAPGAQLAIMKVFSDASEGASSASIIAALEDCVLLNVDVINMSLGSSCGFVRESEDNQYKVNEVYQSVKEAGINLVVAAGNSYSSAYGAENTNSSIVTNPDSATISSPATYPAALSVASVDTELTPFLLANGSKPVFFNQASDSKEYYDFVDLLLGEEESKTFEYVAIDGTGAKEDYNNIDVRGKIVLVPRGTITFEKKQKIAAEFGAAACIIYNNSAGKITMSIEDLMVPTCSISQVAGNELAELETGTITVSKGLNGGPFMSAFSSWGPSPDLQLMPEITAPGGTILSSYRNGYAEASGTSMASPNLAGIVSIMRQHVAKSFPELSKVEQVNLVNQLLMSTANILTDENGNPFSPRKQGAGLAQVTAAVNTDAYITVDGSDKTKISLGDDKDRTGIYTLEFNVINFGTSSQVYTVNPYVMTEGFVAGISTETSTVTERAHMFNDCDIHIGIIDGTMKGDNQIVIPANTTSKVTVTIQLSNEDKLYLDTSFRNGMYIEGFIELISNTNSGINMSIPYLGFYGDWTEAPIFDSDMYTNDENETTPAYYETTPVGLYNNGYYLMPLGSYVYKMEDDAEEVLSSTEKAAISYYSSSIYALYSVYAGMLRNAKTLNYQIKDTLTGEIILEQEVTNAKKSYYNNGPIPHADIVGISPYAYSLPNNRNYTFTMTALLDYGDGGINSNLNNSFSFSFYVDYENPVLEEEKCKFYTKLDDDGNLHYYVDLAMYDNHYIMAYAPCYIENNTANMLSNTFLPNYNEVKNGTTYQTIEITQYMDKFNNGEFGIYIQDYAMNSSIFKLSIPDDIALTYLEEVKFEEEEITIEENETTKLPIVTTPNDAWLGTLKYEFTNEDGDSVNDLFAAENGYIKGYEVGNYKLTITDSCHEDIKETIKINVVSNNNNEGQVEFKDFTFDSITNNGEIYPYKKGFEVHPNETAKLGLKLNPWNADSPVITWKSSDEEVATVDENGVIQFYDVVEETKVRITATVNGISHSTSFVVSSAFLVEGGQLKAYYGSEVDLVIPNNLNIFYIYPQCFANNTKLKSVVLPEELITINSQAFYGCTSLETVVIPKGVTELYIGAGAFYKCTSLTSINLEDAASGIYLGDNCFYGCTSLSNIDLSMVVNMGSNCFYGCTALKSVDITNLRVAGDSIFYGCTGLVDITFGEYTALSNSMFSNCKGLLSIKLPFANIPQGMFYECASLMSVTFTNDVKRIGTQAFKGCKNLTSINFRGNVESIGQQAFYQCTGLTSVKLPNGIDMIEPFAFKDCTNLTTVTIAKEAILSKISPLIFDGCTSLEKFIITAGTQSFAIDSNGIVYRLINGEMTSVVMVPNGSDLTNYKLPETVNKIENGAFAGRKDITNIDLSNIIEIGEYAFYQCANLKSITFSNNLKTIGDSAFYQAKIDEIHLPSSVESIGEYAFAYTGAIFTFDDYENSKITVLPAYSLLGLTNKTIDLPSGLKSIGEGTFFQCQNLVSITLPINCSEIGDYAFRLCPELKEVHFGATTSVGSNIFLNSVKIEKFTAAEGATALGDYMFAPTFTYDEWGNLIVVEESIHKALKEVILPTTIKSIPLYCFAYCDAITSIDLSNITEFYPYAFSDCKGLTELSLDSAQKIGLDEFDTYTNFSYAFYNCINLTTVNMPNVTKIYEAAFYGCTSLKTVNAPNLELVGTASFYNCRVLQNIDFDSAKTIEDFAFYGCAMLSSVEYEYVTKIGISAFYNCANLVKVDLPALVTLGEGAFAGCRDLTEMNIPIVEEIGNQAFLYTNLNEFKIPATVKKIGFGVFTANYNLEAFTIEDGNENYFVSDGVLYEKLLNGKIQLIGYPSGKKDNRFVVIEGVNRISEYAFAYNNHIQSVVLPYTLEYVASRAFYRCTYLTAYEFTSYYAPVLECAMLSTTIHDLNYDNFFDLIGTFDGMYMSSPANGIGYDNYIYRTYFEHNFTSSIVANDETYQVILAIDAIGNFDEYSSRVDGLIKYARALYNRLTDPLQICLVTNYDKLVEAEHKIELLKNNSKVETNQAITTSTTNNSEVIDNDKNVFDLNSFDTINSDNDKLNNIIHIIMLFSVFGVYTVIMRGRK